MVCILIPFCVLCLKSIYELIDPCRAANRPGISGTWYGKGRKITQYGWHLKYYGNHKFCWNVFMNANFTHTPHFFYPYQPSNSCLICKTSFKLGRHVGVSSKRQLKPNSATNRCNSSHAPAVAQAETRCNFAKGGSIFSKCKIRIWPMKLSWKNVPEILWMSLKNFSNVPEGLAEGLAALPLGDAVVILNW